MTPEAIIIQSMFLVQDKQTRQDIPFKLNVTQASLDDGIKLRNIVAKARQEGITTYVLARFAVACLTRQNTRAVVISHERESTERMLATVHYFLENIRGPKPVIEHSSKSEITFPKTNSMFYIGTAGAKKFGRGDTITHFHGSEVAYWDNPKELLGGALQAVPLMTGEVFLESTGNGAGTWFHRTCMDAARGRSPFKLHFFNWIDFPEYDLIITPEQAHEVMSNLQPELDEPGLVENWDLTAGQIMFRRIKLAELDWDVDLFKQEYPITLDECFRTSGAAFFQRILFKGSEHWKQKAAGYHGLLHHPRKDLHYSMGVDSSAGVGQNRSCIEVVCNETNEQVAEYSYDRIPPDALAQKTADIGKEYNDAYAVVESNNHGAVVLDNLRKLYLIGRIHKDRKQNNNLVNLGYRTSVRSKPFALGQLRKSLAQGLLIHSDLLRGELLTFVEKDGKLEAQTGCFDDCVMALAMANIGMPRVAAIADADVIESKPLTAFSFEEIEAELLGRGQGFPIPPQHADAFGESW